jgi:hypothetical protein
MDFYNNFYNTLTLPNTTTWNGWKETARILTITFFSLSIVKDVCGFNWHEMLQLFSVTVLPEDKLEEPKQRSWGEWLASPPYLMIFMIFKVIIFILYWIFKYSLAIQMIPIALFIAVIYFTYTCFFAIYNNCDSECDYSSKRELIDRIIYTRLYDVPKKLEKWYEWGLYLFKTVCWLLMVFMVELLSVWILKEGLNKITSKIGGSKYADGLKLILITIYSCIFCLIGLWCFYKYTFKLPIMETFFSREKDDPEPKKPEENDKTYKLKTGEKDDIDTHGNKVKIPIEIFNKPKYLKDMNLYRKYWKIKDAEDRRFELIKKTNCDKYEKYSENKPFRIIFGGDILNNIVIKEDIDRKRKEAADNKGKPSFTEKWSGKLFETMGNFGDRLLQKSQNTMENIERSYKETEDNQSIFTEFKNMYNSIDMKKANSDALGAASGAFGAASTAFKSASGAVGTQIGDSATLFKENIKGRLSSLFKKD